MSGTPPPVRSVDQFTGETHRHIAYTGDVAYAPTLLQVQADADDAAETIGVLLAERDQLARERDDMLEEYGELRARLDEALAEIADLRTQLASVTSQRDTLRATPILFGGPW